MPDHPGNPDGYSTSASAAAHSVEAQRPTAALIGIASVALAHWRWFVIIPVVVASVVCSMALLAPRTYTSTFSFVPQVTDDGLSKVNGLAAQLGVSIPGVDLTQTPDFYAGLLRSDQFKRSLVEAEYAVAGNGGDTLRSLIAIYEVPAADPLVARDDAVLLLSNNMRVGTDLKTGVIRVATRAKDPALAFQMSERTLELVNRFNTDSRQTRAALEGRFVSGRLTEAKKELRDSEDALQAFLEKNRDYTNAPQLVFERDRLQREVMLRNDLYAALAQRLDQARIEQARNTPAITLVEKPIRAARPDRRFLIYKGVMSLMGGGVFAALLVAFRVAVRRAANAEPDATQHLSSTLNDVVASQPAFLRRMLSR
ncbi:MAG TPA: hypothetical protein VJR92_00660 [Gemmatimonadaceae bacterium]|nr:hypothetical protein [Gemmatimonadaceae bacterium]